MSAHSDHHSSGSKSPSTCSTSPILTSSTASSADPLTCQWALCRERCTSPETLYDHVCERHVGRKSTNNLNLQCQWGNCRTTTVKRDHITSHIRVHVPLKPHKCEFCGKSFKRPQDLKKHVKTHADESVILRSPEPAVSSQKTSNGNSAYQHVNSKSSGYYQDTHMSTGSYGYPGATATHSHYGGAITAPSYGPVYYNIPQAQTFAPAGVVESRKRGFEDLNDFFGNVKRRQVDATEYQDLGSRFSNIVTAGMPMSSFQAGYHAGLRAANGGVPSDNLASATTYQTPMVPSMGNQYSMPFGELKSKADLMTIDHFLEQLQQTVYDNPHQAAPAPVVHVGMPYRSNNSPPHFAHDGSSISSSAGATPEAFSNNGYNSAASVFDDGISTPALTPSSYAAASHSPASSHTNMSPVPRAAHTVSASLYPSLPSFSTLTDAHGVPQNQSGNGAPFSNLGSAYDDFEARRRYSGGFLQRAPPRSLTADSSATSSGSATVSSPDSASGSVGGSPASRRSSIELSKPFRNVGLSSPKMASGRASPAGVKLPGVADITRGNIGENEKERQTHESWVRNVRVIEELLRYVRGRIEKGDFIDNEAGASAQENRQMKEEQQRGSQDGLYPVLRPMETAS